MKKIFAVLAATAVLAGTNLIVFAHGGHHTQTRQYTACAVDDCEAVGWHKHSGAWYCNRYEACTLEGCAQTELHEHDGVTYRCADHTAAGHGCGRITK